MLPACKPVLALVGLLRLGLGGLGTELHDGRLEGGGEDDGSCCVRLEVGALGSQVMALRRQTRGGDEISGEEDSLYVLSILGG
jgi:hypothetical protein